MVEIISEKRWNEAQLGEVHHYDYGNEENYKNSAYIILRDYFQINPEKDLINKKILESGGGCYPAVYFCKGLKKAVNVEPLYNQFPKDIQLKLTDAHIECVSVGFEDYKTQSEFDEVWFFNVLQHVRDPYLQIQNAKKIASTIRVFEPINTQINNEHPHTFSIEFFKDQFPDTEVKLYRGGSSSGFHGANCAYLTWSN